MNIIINRQLSIPLDQITFSYARSSGPGGQNVNKVSSKVILTWRPEESGLLDAESLERLKSQFPSFWNSTGDFIIKSQLTRDQLKNKQDCINKLRHIISTAIIKPKPRIPTKPTKSSIKRRLDNKNRQSEKKRSRNTNWGE